MTAEILAREEWNETGIRITADEQYTFSAEGEWVDWYVHYGPNGGPSRNLILKLFEWARRMPGDN